MRTIGPFVHGRRPGTRCAGRSRAAAARASPSTCAGPRARTCSAGWPRRPTSCARTSGPAPWRPGTSGPTTATRRLVWARISVFGQDGPYSPGPGSTGWASPTAGCSTSPATATARRSGPGVTISDYLTGVFAAEAVLAALYRRDRPDGGDRDGAVWSTPRCTARSCGSSSGRRRPRPARARPASARATGWPTRRRSTTTRRPTASYVCIVGRLRRQLPPAVRGHGAARPGRRPRGGRTLAQRAARGDEINGIVADWTVGAHRGRGGGRLHRRRRAGRHRLRRRRDPRRPAHGRARRPGHRRRPGAGPVRQQAPFPRLDGRPPDSADAGAHPRPAQPRRVVRPGGPHRRRIGGAHGRQE